MIEKYFPEEGTRLVDAIDNLTSITFICANPSWGVKENGEFMDQKRNVTLSDIGVARVFGLDMKSFQRKEFINQVRELFPYKFSFYRVKDWEFPIPAEWLENAEIYVKAAKENRMFNSIDEDVIKSQEPPLYGWCLLNMVIRTYSRLSPESKVIPEDLINLKEHPEKIFQNTSLFKEDIGDGYSRNYVF